MTYIPTNPVFRGDPFTPIYYREREGQTLKIDYSIPYVRSLEEGQAMIGREPGYSPSHSVVRLNFKLSNTTRQIKYATSVIFDFDENRLVNKEIVYLEGDTYEYDPNLIRGGNIGWTNLHDLEASFGVVSKRECDASQIEQAIELHHVKLHTTIDKESGGEEFLLRVDPSYIPKKVRSRSNGHACAIGYLDYTATGVRYHRPFSTLFRLSKNQNQHAAYVASAFYNLQLEAGRRNYRVQLPVSNYLDPMKPDFFVVLITANRSAFFRFQTKVKFTDGEVLPLGNVELNYFRPKGTWVDPEFVDSISQIPPMDLPPFMEPTPKVR